MTESELFLRLGLALAIGFAMGLERGWQEREEREGQRTAGLRTFSLIGLLGGVLGALSTKGDSLFFASGFLVTGLALGAFMLRESVRENDYSATSLVASLLTLALGAYAVLGNAAAAAGAGVAAVALLAYKQLLHGWLKRLTWAELRAGLVLAAMTFILLPLLPDRNIDPWGAINPHELWLMTVLIAAFSFAGYVAVKYIGPERGLVFAASAGGMVSSTAVTLSVARMANENPGRAALLAASVLAAGCVMLLRVLAIAGVLNLDLMLALLPSLLASAVVMSIFAAVLMRQESSSKSSLPGFTLTNPFELTAVLRFGLLLTVIVSLVAAGGHLFGGAGLLAIAALSGLADTDAITLSMARLGEVSSQTRNAVLVTVLVNSVAKAAYSAWAGTGRLAARVSMGTAAAILAGGLALLI
jgi:uncharacterized membrane protein (DUF4010 family)